MDFPDSGSRPPVPRTRVALRDQRGFALILVIAVLSVLALLAAAIAVETRSTALGAHSRLEIVQARALADSGVTIAIMHVLDRNKASRWQADGAMHEERYGDGSVRITIEDEAGKIDLNNAPKELIAGLLGEFVSAEQASALTDAILERRASFAAMPESAGRLYAGGLAGFQSLALLAFSDISELHLIPGMSAALYDQLAPYVTVYSQSPTLNHQTASRVALLAIPNVAAGDVDALIASRGATEAIGPAQLSAFARYTRVANLQAATIVAEASLPGGISFTREAVVAIEPDLPLASPRILRWRQRAEGDDRVAAAVQDPD
jgi:general secretion pathway protein K